MKTTVGTVFTLAMLLLGTGVAHADPPTFNSDEQAYLRELHGGKTPCSGPGAKLGAADRGVKAHRDASNRGDR
jgi:hypothetical protein